MVAKCFLEKWNASVTLADKGKMDMEMQWKIIMILYSWT